MISSTNIATDIKPYISFTAKFIETTMDIEPVPTEIAQNRFILPSIPAIKLWANRLLIFIRSKPKFQLFYDKDTFEIFKEYIDVYQAYRIIFIRFKLFLDQLRSYCQRGLWNLSRNASKCITCKCSKSSCTTHLLVNQRISVDSWEIWNFVKLRRIHAIRRNKWYGKYTVVLRRILDR